MKSAELRQKLSQSVSVYKSQLSEIRTGAANPGLVENVKVEAYPGSFLTIKELATIAIVDPTLIVLSPWDGSVIPAIEKAIRVANIGLNPSVDKNTIKVPVPSLNEEQRLNFVKRAKEKLEEGKIAIRNIRQDAMKSIDEQEDNSLISEDEAKRMKEEVESEVKKTNSEIEEMFKVKEIELLKL